MELLIVLGALIGLAVTALRFGQDSRTDMLSYEEHLASHGRWHAH